MRSALQGDAAVKYTRENLDTASEGRVLFVPITCSAERETNTGSLNGVFLNSPLGSSVPLSVSSAFQSNVKQEIEHVFCVVVTNIIRQNKSNCNQTKARVLTLKMSLLQS